MEFLKKIFRRKSRRDEEVDSFDLTIGDIHVKALESTDSYALVQFQGIGKNPGDAVIAATIETSFIEAHPCNCGGQWIVDSSASAYPTAYKDCVCKQCGASKKFEFTFT